MVSVVSEISASFLLCQHITIDRKLSIRCSRLCSAFIGINDLVLEFGLQAFNCLLIFEFQSNCLKIRMQEGFLRRYSLFRVLQQSTQQACSVIGNDREYCCLYSEILIFLKHLLSGPRLE